MRAGCRQSSGQSGLTLVEVAFALGIGALVLTILAGTLGSTVEYAAEGFDRFATARISQTLADENRMLEWDMLDTEIDSGRTFYFDERGGKLTSKTSDAVYAARMTLVEGPPLPGPGLSENEHLRRLIIEVSSRGLAEDPFGGEQSVQRFSTLYTRMESLSSNPSEE